MKATVTCWWQSWTASMRGHGHQRPDSLRMFALDVGPAFRCRGVSTALIAAIEEMARDRGMRYVNLEVSVANGDAARLYERLGYDRVGDPEMVRWSRPAEDGSIEEVDDLWWIMVKQL